MIREFEKLGKQVFGCCNLSGTATQKVHLLDHLSEQMREFSAIQNMHAGLYEGSYNVFKAEYEKTSKQKKTAMDKTIMFLNTQIGCLSLDSNGRKTVSTTKPAEEFAVAEACLV